MTWWHRHAYLLLYIVFSVASQLIIRWRVGGAGALAPGADRLQFVLHLLAMPWVWAAFLSTVLAGVMWMLTLGRLDLTYAFPFTGITFLVILFAGAFVFGEPVSAWRVIGTLLVDVPNRGAREVRPCHQRSGFDYAQAGRTAFLPACHSGSEPTCGKLRCCRGSARRRFIRRKSKVCYLPCWPALHRAWLEHAYARRDRHR